MKKLIVGLGGVVWVAVAIKMRWDLLLTGQTPLMDFDIYYQTAKDVLAGQHPLSLPYLQTGGPPAVILPFIPFMMLPLPVARAVIGWSSLAAIIGAALITAKRLFPRYAIEATVLLATLWLVAFPSRFTLQQGQPNLLIMFLMALILNGSKNSCCWASIATLVKTNYLVMIASLPIKMLLKALGILSLLVLMGFGVIKPGYYVDFIRVRGEATFNQGGRIADVDYYNQSLKSTMARFSGSDYYALVFWLGALISGVYLFRSKNIRAGILLSLLLSPMLWQHYVVVAYPVAVELFKKRPWMGMVGMGLMGVEFPQLHGQPLTPLNSMLASHYFIGLMILLAAAVISRREKTVDC